MNQKAYFAAGCFWGVEDAFRKVAGVIDVVSGYAGGEIENPTYEQVCTGKTGHAETVEVTFDSEKVSYEQLLEVFFGMHNPTTYHRQGADIGSQYRSAIFYIDDTQKQAAEHYIKHLEQAKKYERPIVTEVEKAGPFYKAEEYHQRYYEKHNLQSCHI